MNALALFLSVATRRDIAFTLVLPARAAKTRPPRRRLLCGWRKDPLTATVELLRASEFALAAPLTVT